MEMLLIFLTVTLHCVLGFLPQFPPANNKDTKTHYDITNDGTIAALSEYILRSKLTSGLLVTNPIEEFFANDSTAKDNFYNTIIALRSAVADTQTNRQTHSYIHVNGEQITEAHNSVISCREKVFQRRDNIEELRKQLGECLYTVQSFYSNTNWVEMKGSLPYLDFGDSRKTILPVGSRIHTCRDMPSIDENCKDNLLVDSILTSGYHEGRGDKKPTQPKNSPVGKCSHGGPDDESRKLIAKCGINKDTTNEKLSPHYHLHNEAYQGAVAATKHFLIDDGITS